MKVILLADIKGVGKKGQVISSSDGYARNFLFPKKLALEANEKNMSELKAKQDSDKYRKGLELEKAKKIAEEMKTMVLTIKVKAGENGKIFGGVTSKEISENLKKQYSIEVDKKKIAVPETIKTLGRFMIEVKLQEGVNAKLAINIISD